MRCKWGLVIGVLLIVFVVGFFVGRASLREELPDRSILAVPSDEQLWWARVAGIEEGREMLQHWKARCRDLGRYDVVKIVDGDTLDIKDHSGIMTRIRLYGYDAPEPGEPGGTEATAKLTALAAGKWVTVLPQARDKYGRTVALLFLEGGAELGTLMVSK